MASEHVRRLALSDECFRTAISLNNLLECQAVPTANRVAVGGRLKAVMWFFVNDQLGRQLEVAETNPETTAAITFRSWRREQAPSGRMTERDRLLSVGAADPDGRSCEARSSTTADSTGGCNADTGHSVMAHPEQVLNGCLRRTRRTPPTHYGQSPITMLVAKQTLTATSQATGSGAAAKRAR